MNSLNRMVDSSWNVMAHGDAREGKWRGNWQMEWVSSTLTLPRNMVYPALLPLMRTPRLPVVDWTDALAYLNGLVRFSERRNLVSARVLSHFNRSLSIFFISIPYICGRFVQPAAPSMDQLSNLSHITVLLTSYISYLPPNMTPVINLLSLPWVESTGSSWWVIFHIIQRYFYRVI